MLHPIYSLVLREVLEGCVKGVYVGGVLGVCERCVRWGCVRGVLEVL